MALRISLFGSMEVVVDGEPRPVTRLQVRRLLSLLAAHDGSVSTDRLIEHLWPTGLPASPRKALNVVLSRARALLSPHDASLVTVDDGYRLDDAEIDLAQFSADVDALLATEPTETTIDRCIAWLLDWSPPFADDPDADALRPIAADLARLRRAATLAICDAGALGSAGRRELVVERLLARLHAEWPGDEEVGLALADHVAALGRRDEALRVVGATTRWLRTELGVEPRPEWHALEQRLITAGVGEALPLRREVEQPPARTVVGRDDVIEQLMVASGVVVVAGEPGIGKSSILAEVEHRLRRGSKGPVAVGAAAARPDGPLDPLADMCADLIAAGADLVGVESAIARICPDVVDGGRSLMGRTEFDQQVASFVVRSARAVVIDDAQWLQGGPAAVVAEMSAVNGSTPIVIGHNTAHTLPGEVAAMLGAATVIEVAPLREPDVAAMFTEMGLGSVGDDVTSAIHRASGGNALLASMLVDDWIEGRWRPGQGSAPTVDLRAVVRRRLDELTRNDIDTISLAAVMGSTFRRSVLAELDANADQAIDAAMRVGLLAEGDDAGFVRFRHGLVAEECARRVPAARLVGLHDRLHQTLRAAGISPVEYFPHAIEAVAVDPLGAIEAAVAAAGEHAGSFSWEAAAGALDRAVEIARDHEADDDLMAELLVRRGAVRRALLDVRYVDDLRQGIEAARRVGRHDLVVTGVTELISHGVTTRAGAVDDELGRTVEAALELDVDDVLRAELCSAAATFFAVTVTADRSRGLYAEAIAIARRSGDRTLEERVLLNAQTGASHPDDFPQLRAAALRLADLATCAESRWESAFLRFGTGAVLGDPAEVAASMRTMLDTVAEVKERPRLFGTAFSLAAHDLLRGDIERAEARVDQVIEIGLRSYDPSWVMGIASMMLLSTRAASGSIESLRGAVDGLIDETPDYLAYRAVRSAMAAESGDHELARSDLDLLLADDLGGVAREFHWTMVLALASRAAVAVGTDAQRALLESELSAHAGQMTWNGVCSAGPVDEVLAVLTDEAAAASLLAERGAKLRQRFVDALEPIDSSGFDALVAASAVPAQTATS